MGYVNNAKLIEQWNTRYQAIINRINTLYDVSAHNLVFEDTRENAVLGAQSLDTAQGAGGMVLTIENPELVSNGQAPQVVIETPTLTLEAEEGTDDKSDQEEDQGTDEATNEATDEVTDEETEEEDETKEEIYE